MDPRARRRPLRLSARGTRRPDARPCVAHAPRAAPAARRDGRAGAAARVLRPADRGEARAPARADDHPHDLRGRAGTPAPRADDDASSARSRRRSCGRSGCTRAGAPRSSGSAARSSSSGCTTSRPASSQRGSSASAASGRGRSASSASRGSAATTTGSSAISGSSSSCARCAGRPVEGWETAELLEPYGEWAGPREHVSARRLFARSARRVTSAHGAHRDHRRRPHRRSAALGPAELGLERHRRHLAARGACRRAARAPRRRGDDVEPGRGATAPRSSSSP